MFSRGKRSCPRVLQHLEIQSFSPPSFGADIVDRRFGYAVDDQRYAVSPGFELGIIVTTVGHGVNFSNFVCVTALDANLSARDWTGRILHDSTQSRLSGF